MPSAQLVRDIALLRDRSAPPARRALAAVAVSEGAASADAAIPDTPATRMFGFNTRHDEAVLWDGRGMRSGTITYLDDARVEQYVGQGRWIAYDRAQLGVFAANIGDQVRIVQRPGGVATETIGPNRLDAAGSAGREVASGLYVLRTSEVTRDELDALASAIAERSGAVVTATDDGVGFDFRGAAQLHVAAVASEPFAPFGESTLLSAPVVCVLRLSVVVRSAKPEAALEAERALMLLAGMLAAEAESIALDDGGAVFCAEELYVSATRNEMRADRFALAAAAAQRNAPPPQLWFSNRQGVCDELIVFSSRAWRAEFAATFLERELDGLSIAARTTADPIVPLAAARAFSNEERSAPGKLQRLASLSFEAVDLDIAFLDITCSDADLRPLVLARTDIETLLGRPPASAVVIAYGNRGDDPESDTFALEMRRAEALATTLAAAFADRGDCVATDVAGALYAAEDLQQLARRRCGKSASWNARVAEFTRR
ncbi:MAG: hypothetical protein ABSB70_04505 [Candidatus Velthaea sp.]